MYCDMDLFANRTNHQLPNYISWLPDPKTKTFDALLHPWSKINAYAFPPFCLISQCLRKFRMVKVTEILITAAWTAQSWYSTLLEMSIQDPILLPIIPQILKSSVGNTHPIIQNNSFQLIDWLISGDLSAQWNYQKMLTNF